MSDLETLRERFSNTGSSDEETTTTITSVDGIELKSFDAPVANDQAMVTVNESNPEVEVLTEEEAAEQRRKFLNAKAQQSFTQINIQPAPISSKAERNNPRENINLERTRANAARRQTREASLSEARVINARGTEARRRSSGKALETLAQGFVNNNASNAARRQTMANYKGQAGVINAQASLNRSLTNDSRRLARTNSRSEAGVIRAQASLNRNLTNDSRRLARTNSRSEARVIRAQGGADFSRNIGNTIENFGIALGDTFRSFGQGAVDIARTGVDTAGYTVKRSVDGIMNIAETGVDTAGYTVKRSVDGVMNIAETGVDAAAYTVKRGVDAGAHVVEGAVDTASYAAKRTVDGTMNIAENLASGAVDIARTGVNTAAYAAEGVVDIARTGVNTAANIAERGFDGAMNIAETGVQTAAHAVEGAVDITKNAVNTALDTTSHVVKDLSSTTSHILKEGADTFNHVVKEGADTLNYAIKNRSDTKAIKKQNKSNIKLYEAQKQTDLKTEQSLSALSENEKNAATERKIKEAQTLAEIETEKQRMLAEVEKQRLLAEVEKQRLLAEIEVEKQRKLAEVQAKLAMASQRVGVVDNESEIDDTTRIDDGNGGGGNPPSDDNNEFTDSFELNSFDKDLLYNRKLVKASRKNLFDKVSETDLGLSYTSRYKTVKEDEKGKKISFTQTTYIATSDIMNDSLLNVLDSESGKTLISLKEIESNPFVTIDKQTLNENLIKLFQSKGFEESENSFTVPVETVMRTNSKVMKFKIIGVDLGLDVDAKNIKFTVQDKDDKTVTHVHQPSKEATFDFQINTSLTEKLFSENNKYLFVDKNDQVLKQQAKRGGVISNFDPKEFLALAKTAKNINGVQIFNKDNDSFPKILYTKLKDSNQNDQDVLMVKFQDNSTYMLGNFSESTVSFKKVDSVSFITRAEENITDGKNFDCGIAFNTESSKPLEIRTQIPHENHNERTAKNTDLSLTDAQLNLISLNEIEKFIGKTKKLSNSQQEQVNGITFSSKDSVETNFFDSSKKYSDFTTEADLEKPLIIDPGPDDEIIPPPEEPPEPPEEPLQPPEEPLQPPEPPEVKKEKMPFGSILGPLGLILMALGAILMLAATIFSPVFAAIGIGSMALGAAIKGVSMVQMDDENVLEKAIKDHQKEKKKSLKEKAKDLAKGFKQNIKSDPYLGPIADKFSPEYNLDGLIENENQETTDLTEDEIENLRREVENEPDADEAIEEELMFNGIDLRDNKILSEKEKEKLIKLSKKKKLSSKDQKKFNALISKGGLSNARVEAVLNNPSLLSVIEEVENPIYSAGESEATVDPNIKKKRTKKDKDRGKE